MINNPQFNWSADPDVVVGPQQAIAIYANKRGEIVVAQERDAYSEEDTIVLVRPENAMAVSRAILKVAADLGVNVNEARAAAPKDETAAERQRRHRDKNRDVTETRRDSHAQVPLKVVGE